MVHGLALARQLRSVVAITLSIFVDLNFVYTCCPGHGAGLAVASDGIVLSQKHRYNNILAAFKEVIMPHGLLVRLILHQNVVVPFRSVLTFRPYVQR